MKEVVIGDCRLICADCLDVLPGLQREVVVITDPPYPELEYDWGFTPLESLGLDGIRQFYFWMRPPHAFPLPFTAMHVWSKANVYIGDCEQWEAIYEVNGGKVASVLRESAINCEMNAVMNRDKFYNHPTQKPQRLMRRLITRTEGTVVDPFMGSGTTGVACVREGRAFIGIEKNEDYFNIAVRRIQEAYDDFGLFNQGQP